MSCANQVAPTGGDKDVTPPVLLSVIPENGTTNFQYTAITFVFDEFIDVKLPNPTFTVAPEWPEDINITTKKRVVTLTIPDNLLPNTTYTINFGRALKDINEGNVLEDLTYAFSTGPVIDSLAIEGTVYSLLKDNNPSTYQVGLFVQEKDSILLYSKPIYSTKTNESGLFSFQYLPEKPFYLLAWDDSNSDRKISYGEPFGFIDTMVKPGQANSYTLLIGTTWWGNRKPILNTINNRHFFLSPFDEAWSVSIDTSADATIDRRPDTLFLQFPYNLTDSISFTVALQDTTLPFTLRPRFGKDIGNTFECSTPRLLLENGLPVITLPFSVPTYVNMNNSNNISIQTDSTVSWIHGDSGRMVQLLASTPIWGDTVTIVVPEGALVNTLGQQSTTDTFRLAIPTLDDLGTATITIDSAFIRTPHLIHLYDNDGRLVAQCLSCTQITATALLPGKYHLEIIGDRNKNYQWDGGNFFLGIQPEPREWRRDALEIKANWEISIELKP